MVTDRFLIEDLQHVNMSGADSVTGQLTHRPNTRTRLLFWLAGKSGVPVLTDDIDLTHSFGDHPFLTKAQKDFFYPLEARKHLVHTKPVYLLVSYDPIPQTRVERRIYQIADLPVAIDAHEPGGLYIEPYSAKKSNCIPEYRIDIPGGCWITESPLLRDADGHECALPEHSYRLSDSPRHIAGPKAGSGQCLRIPVYALSSACTEIVVAYNTDCPYNVGTIASKKWFADECGRGFGSTGR